MSFKFGLAGSDPAAANFGAISEALAILELAPDGTILSANQIFLDMYGYTLDELKGRHHRMLVSEQHAQSAEYQGLWSRIAVGEVDKGGYARVAKGGREVYIRGSYSAVRDKSGKPTRIVETSIDTTTARLSSLESQSKLDAIGRVQAVIEFQLDGTIIDANENFCRTVGYDVSEVRGRHHRMFVDPTHASSAEYQQFWARLAKGEAFTGEYRRFGKGGREVWLQASYIPILDLEGKPIKVVKYAADATEATARKKAVEIMGAQLTRLADGDLMTTIDEQFDGDLERLRTAFNGTVATMTEIVGRLRTASTSLKTATGEILSGANDLADRTTKQAAAVEETSAALEQLSGTVAENAKRASSASAKAKLVQQTANDTNGVMKEANDAMERISASSTKISNIIGLIDDIAFQTNLLALNASGEAARAGDAGKGFAVVAVEVRRLAQSAAGASSEVKALIEQSVTEVTTGSRKVAEATQKVTSMLDGIHENGTLIEEITRATGEQSAAIRELTTSVKEVDEMTQHNAALVEETNAAIEQTESQAIELDRIVDVFVVEDAPPPVAAKRGPRSAVDSRRTAAASRTYLSEGNAALKSDEWNEF